VFFFLHSFLLSFFLFLLYYYFFQASTKGEGEGKTTAALNTKKKKKKGKQYNEHPPQKIKKKPNECKQRNNGHGGIHADMIICNTCTCIRKMRISLLDIYICIRVLLLFLLSAFPQLL